MTIKLYVEGGGNTRNLKIECRQGFSEFLRRAGFQGRMPRITACGSRENAYNDFRTAAESADSSEFIVLLVDSEGPVLCDDRPWEHLRKKDNWSKPANAAVDSAHLMTQCMEAWFAADRETLGEYFGQGFKAGALPDRNDVENIGKNDLYATLEKATWTCHKKGRYDKGRHSFDILARLNPEKVTSASPHAKGFIDTLRRKTGNATGPES